MGPIGPSELIIILALALIVFGPKKLPDICKSLGQGIREFKKASRDIMTNIEDIGSDLDIKPEQTPVHTSEQTKES